MDNDRRRGLTIYEHRTYQVQQGGLASILWGCEDEANVILLMIEYLWRNMYEGYRKGLYMTVKLTSGLNLPSFFWRTKSQTLLDENVRWKKDTLRAFYGILHACLLKT